jgi:ATP-dependent Clp protease ATP-binding subunit ClpX
MLDVMYDLPSLTGVKKCVVNKEVVEKREAPTLIFAERPKDQSA